MVEGKPADGEGRVATYRMCPLAGARMVGMLLAVAAIAGCATTPPPVPPLVEAGLFYYATPKVQTIEFVPIPSTASCKVTGEKGRFVGEFSGRRVLSVSLGDTPVTMVCNAPGYLAARRTIVAEKTQAAQGTGAVILVGVLAGPAAAAGVAIKMRREKALWLA